MLLGFQILLSLANVLLAFDNLFCRSSIPPPPSYPGSRGDPQGERSDGERARSEARERKNRLRQNPPEIPPPRQAQAQKSNLHDDWLTYSYQ